jgi:hypothetical protein
MKYYVLTNIVHRLFYTKYNITNFSNGIEKIGETGNGMLLCIYTNAFSVSPIEKNTGNEWE